MSSHLVCAVPNCGAAAAFTLHLNDCYHGDERYYEPLGVSFCTRHALENEIGARGDLPGPRCYRHYPYVRLRTTGFLTYKLLPGADIIAKRSHRLLPKKPRLPWAPTLPRDVHRMRGLLDAMGGAR